jgi:signal transduction histidine kinase/ligand-binding sensor domain-containing protein
VKLSRFAKLGILLTWCPCAFSLNPALDISQYAHNSWKNRDGFTRGIINAIAQTPDGYLWFGTDFGLLRFDGVRKVSWPPPDQPLPSDRISQLLAARDGTLWISTNKGLASWKDGKLTTYPELAGLFVGPLLEDREGSIWVGSHDTPSGRLCEIRNGAVHCRGEDGSLGRGIFGLFQDRNGNLWAGAESGGLWRWKPSPPIFLSGPAREAAIQGFDQTDDGTLLIGTSEGVKRVADGKVQPHILPGFSQPFSAKGLLRDRDGGLWIGTRGRGLVHVHQGRTDVFAQFDGLSGNTVQEMLEDREGSIWVSTFDGLDRFREFAVSTISANQGLSNAGVSSILADRDGGMWLGTNDGLDRWNQGQMTIYRKPGGQRPVRAAQRSGVPEIAISGLPDNRVMSLLRDGRGRIWVSTWGGAGYLENERFTPVHGIPGGYARSIAEDTAGNLWIAHQDAGLLRLSSDGAVDPIPWRRLGHSDYAAVLAADSSRGGLWIGYQLGGIAYFHDGQIRATYPAGKGMGEGRVNGLRLDRDTLWAATDGGLSRLKNGRIATLTSKNGLPCDGIHLVMEDDSQAFWLLTACGLVRIARSDLDHWAAVADRNDGSKWTVHASVWDNSDGISARALAVHSTPLSAKSQDGKLWFTTGGDVSVVDPLHLPFNKTPPPVYVEAVKIDGKETAPSEGFELSHSTKDIEIDYTALSLVIPERVRFKYRLEGEDSDWVDVGPRGQAYYNNLSPKKYRFRVIACNNDGVWNEAGATWTFSVIPAYYQTAWFQALCVIAAGVLAWTLYRLRLRTMSARINLLYNERLAERTRIARDLHDSLLQSLAGVSLQLHGIAKTAAKAPEKTPSQVDKIREQVDATFREARSKVYNLRSPALEGQGLTEALSDFVERLGPMATARCTLHVTGEPIHCTPEIEEELLRIAQEAANNANRHAGAKEIRLALEYGGRSLKLSVCDDGCGFRLEEGLAKNGHWGLKNMPERAAQIRGKCTITSSPGHGTQIEVHVPLRRWSLRKNLAKRANSSSGD